MIAFLLGLVLGNFFGFIIAGLMNASYEAERERERDDADRGDR